MPGLLRRLRPVAPGWPTANRSWITEFNCRVPWHGPHYAVASAANAAILFALGLIAAAAGGFVDLYAGRTIAVGAVTIAWVFWFGDWAGRHLESLPREIRGAFTVAEGEYRAFYERWYRRVFHDRLTLGGGGVLAILLVVYVFVFPGDWGIRLESAWSEGPHLWLKKLVIAAYAVVAALLGWQMVLGFGEYLWFVFRVARHDVAAPLAAARSQLRPITRFGTVTGAGWAAALVSLAVFYWRHHDALVYALLGVLVACDVALVLGPQLAVHRALVRARDRLILAAGDKLRTRVGTPMRDADYVTAVTAADEQAGRIDKFIDATQRSSTWIYAPANFVVFLGQLIIPAAALAASLVIKK